MAPVLEQIISFFASSQGSILYSLVLVLLSVAALVASLYAGGQQVSSQGSRMQRGLLYLLFLQILLFVFVCLAWFGIIDEHAFLPPLERIFALFSLVLAIWLWVFPHRVSISDEITVAVEATILVAGGYGLYWWFQQDPNTPFNTSYFGAYAYYIGLILVLIGLALLVWQRPILWQYGIIMLVVLLAGYLAQYLIRQPAGDYASLVRLGEMVSFTLLLFLPKRLPIVQEEKTLDTGISAGTLRVDINLIRSMLNLSSQKSTPQYYQELTRMVAQVMDAEYCLLMIPPKVGEQIIIPVGYDLVRGSAVEAFTVDGHRMPLLLGAIKMGNQVLINGSSSDSEIRTLTREIELAHLSHLLAVPFKADHSSYSLGLVLLSKPARLPWTERDGTQLLELLNALTAHILPDEKSTLKATSQEVEQYQKEISQLQAQNMALKSQLSQIQPTLGSAAGMMLSNELMQEKIKELESRNQEMENLLARNRSYQEEVEQLRQELRSALEELARMPTTLSKSDQKMLEMQLSAMKHLDDLGEVELVTSIGQELRQPLSSIIGYTDLLLGESVGLLGAMQRKFLERIRASSERLGTLMNELIQVLAIDGGQLDQTQSKVDLEAVVDDAVGNIIAQISEKNITMRVDLPEKLPEIHANRDALQQILSNLLQNACLVTPTDGEISLYARVESKENEPDYLFISVTDQGGGISREDVPRIFLRHYKLDNPLIQGIGDTGVGLSIVKSLVELNKGRIWVDIHEGIGSTFSCVIPLADILVGGLETPSAG